MSDKPEIILVHETVAQAWGRDASSVVGFVTIIGIGVYLESSAMQWVGAILGFITIVGRAISFGNSNKMSVSQARKRLDEIEARALSKEGGEE